MNAKYFLSVLLVALFISTTAVQGFELPDDVKVAVAKRKGKTVLSKLAASMEPGTWAELKADVPKRLWTSPPPSRGLHIAGWTDDAHWDSRTGQFLYMGMRQTRQFIAYSETNNTWRVITLDPKTNNPCFRSRFGHIYSSNGFDDERSRFYHRYNSFIDKKEDIHLEGGISFFDALTEKWTKLPPRPRGVGGGSQCIEYFSAMDGLVWLGKQTCIFNNKRQKWESIGASPVNGYHSLIRHNPYRNEILMGGGNQSPRVMARITKDGKIERLKDFPRKMSVQGDKVTIDPQSGRYLIFQFSKKFEDGTQIKVYEFDSDKNEYLVVKKAAAEFPWSYYKRAYTVCAFIPEYNVIMFANGSTFLYKHDPSIEYPVAVPEPTKPKGKKKGKK